MWILEIDVVQMPDGQVFVTDEKDLEERLNADTSVEELMERAKKAAYQRWKHSGTNESSLQLLH